MRSAVSISCEFIMKPASPVHRDHLAIGIGQLGRDRAGHRDAHRREAVGDDAGVGTLGLYIRDIHILWAPTSEIAMSFGPSTSRRSQTIFCGLTGKPVSRRILRTIGDDGLAHGLERRELAAASRCSAMARNDVWMSPSTPTATM